MALTDKEIASRKASLQLRLESIVELAHAAMREAKRATSVKPDSVTDDLVETLGAIEDDFEVCRAIVNELCDCRML